MKKENLEIEIYEKQPEGFSPQMQVAGCCLEIADKILLLQLAQVGSESGKWSVPAGKLEQGETAENAAIRELFEETGIVIEPLSQLQHLGSLYIRKPTIDYIYHHFRIRLNQAPSVHLSQEHQNYRWTSLKDLKELPLLSGAQEILQRYQKPTRIGASVNAYLLLKQNDKVLFQLRKNTGYCDGMWGLVAGHVEDGESASAAMIREAFEEIGIDISSSALKVIYVMHRKTNRFNVDIFFECSSWRGELKNIESEKCEKLEFFSLNSLPSLIIDYQGIALENISKDQYYSEIGWDLENNI